MKCPHCASPDIVKAGFRIISGGERKQRYRCKSCGRSFYKPKEGEAYA